jgi:hypothetical protein
VGDGSPSWEIGEWDAEKCFGVKAHASLSAPYHGTIPAEVLDPQGLYAKLFCDKVKTDTNATIKRQCAGLASYFDGWTFFEHAQLLA